MAAILQFQHRKKSEPTSFDAGHSALILLYTGVRFERIDFEALRSEAHAERKTIPAATARFAT
jgi:hypothetical protein